MLSVTTLFMEFCPDISLVKPQLPCPVCSLLKRFFPENGIWEQNERAAIQDCALPGVGRLSIRCVGCLCCICSGF